MKKFFKNPGNRLKTAGYGRATAKPVHNGQAQTGLSHWPGYDSIQSQGVEMPQCPEKVCRCFSKIPRRREYFHSMVLLGSPGPAKAEQPRSFIGPQVFRGFIGYDQRSVRRIMTRHLPRSVREFTARNPKIDLADNRFEALDRRTPCSENTRDSICQREDCGFHSYGAGASVQYQFDGVTQLLGDVTGVGGADITERVCAGRGERATGRAWRRH